ncbi:MAG: hypothetical protein IIC30_06720 [Chloroflexi bacterium]|nr:hypothetical protein [Chloroflexota bacterium]
MAVSDLDPFIVPPSLDKSSHLLHTTLRLTWRLAAEAVQAADAVVVLGYSLPATDLVMKSFLKVNAPTAKVPLIVVDPSDTTAKNFECALRDHYCVDRRFVGTDSIERMVNEYTDRN